MKIEQIIVLHLYHHKQVTLQGIGTFHLDASIPLPAVNNTPPSFPEKAVTFEYNPKAAEDATLIDSIVQYTKKLRPLAAADLDSYLQWQKQLLNINMPFTFQGVGMLQKDPQGELQFIPSASPASPSQNKMHTGAHVLSNTYNLASIRQGKKFLPLIIIVLGLSLIAWLILKYATPATTVNKSPAEEKPEITPANTASMTRRDTPERRRRTSLFPENMNAAYVFKIILFKSRTQAEASDKLNEIYGFGHSAIMYAKDSLYEIAMPFNRPVSDTSHIKDSLNKYYSLGLGTVEVNN